jgi:hypothetical protein
VSFEVRRVHERSDIASSVLGTNLLAWAEGVALDHETTLALVRESLRE